MRLKDKIALITGGAGGIGLVTAKRFASEGAAIVISDLNEENLAKVAAGISSTGAKVMAVTADLTKKGDVDATVGKVIREYGRLDILISNAGANKYATVKKMTEDQWSRNIPS